MKIRVRGNTGIFNISGFVLILMCSSSFNVVQVEWCKKFTINIVFLTCVFKVSLLIEKEK